MEVLMQFDGRRMRIDVTHRLLGDFARSLNMPFDEAPNQINIIILRGAKPVALINDTVVDTPAEVVAQVQRYIDDPEAADAQDEVFSIELADDEPDRYNDTLIFAWIDERNRPHVRAMLGSADPGRHYIENPEELDQNAVASVAPGSYQARSTQHNGQRALQLAQNGNLVLSGRRITDYEINEDGSIIITEYTYYGSNDEEALTNILIHAGGIPSNRVNNWSGGCTVIATSQVGRPEYLAAIGAQGESWLDIDQALPQEILMENPFQFNVIVWNAWSLYMYTQALLRGYFYPVLEFGARDLGARLPLAGPNVNRWVTKMQNRLNHQLERLYPHEEAIEEQLGLQVPNPSPVNGIFGNETGAALRGFQEICTRLLDNEQLHTEFADIDADEVWWEHSKWLCGPHTWRLLRSESFITGQAPEPEIPWLR